MISYLSGKIILKKENFVIVEVNGVGYEVFVSQPSFERIPPKESFVNTKDPTGQAGKGENLNLFCCLEASERGVKLYGFLSFEELELFKIIRGVQGTGPRAALEIASAGSLAEIKEQIKKGDTKFLEDLPGIGKKKAAKIILELSGQFKAVERQKPEEPQVDEEALSALMALGFSKNQARETLSQIPPEIKNSQERIKQALQILGK